MSTVIHKSFVAALIVLSSNTLANTFELSPTTPAVSQPGQQRSDLTGSSEVLVETLLTGTIGTYDSTKVFANISHEFSLNTQTLVTTSNTDYSFLKNLLVEGVNRDSDQLIFSSLSLSPRTPFPTPDPYRIFMGSIEVKDATLNIIDPTPSNNINNGVNIASIEQIKLDNAVFNININEGSIAFNSGGKLVASSGDNIWNVPGGEVSGTRYSVDIEENASLTLQNSSSLNSTNGALTIKSGGTLNLNNSAMTFDSDTLFSSIDNATVNLNGTYGTALSNGVGYSYLDLNKPNITDSTFNLDNNTALRGRARVIGGINDSTFTLKGNNTFNLGDGAYISMSGDNANRYRGRFIVDGGTTKILSTVTGTRVKSNGLFAFEWWVKNSGTLIVNDVDGSAGLKSLLAYDNSTLQMHTLDSMDSLSVLEIRDSTLESSVLGYKSSVIKLNNATLKPEEHNGLAHESIVFNGDSPNTHIVTMAGTNNIKIDLTPQGRDIGFGLKTYNDEFNIYDSEVVGFNTINYEIDTQTTGQTSKQFAEGGSTSNGRYQISNLAGSTIDNDISDSDITLSASMPALLQASLASTPSTDKTVVVQLTELPTSVLPMLPQVATSGSGTQNTQNAAQLLSNAAQTNEQIENQLQQLTQQQLTEQFPSIHPEPYSSFITVGLEQTDMTLKTVMRHASTLSTFSVGESLTQNVSNDPQNASDNTIWSEATYLNGNVDGTDNMGGYEYDLAALTLGRTFLDKKDYSWGGFISIGHSHMNEHDNVQQDFKSNNIDIGLYHRSNHYQKLELSSALGLSMSRIKSQRYFSIASSNYKANSTYNSQTLYLGINASYEWVASDWGELRPHIGMHGIYSKQDEVKENGADVYSMRIDESENSALVTSAGLHALFASISQKNKIRPIIGLTYEHDWQASQHSAHDITAAISADPEYKLSFEGRNRGADAWIADMGLRGEVSENGIINGGLSYSKTSHGKEWGAGIRAEWLF